MKRVALILALTLTTIMGSFSQPTPAAAQSATRQSTTSLAIPIVGSGSGLTFTGIFNLKRFAVDDGGVVAIGTLTGTVTDAAGTVVSVITNVALPIAVGQTTCDILHLDLGPLHLDLLGLQVDLSRIVLDITAQSGAGKLLGNLLCGIAGLLDDPSGLARLLNQILDILS
jgi:hypothetical protein